jgi:hypothetical protein
MRVDGSFHAKYRELEERMKALAEYEGNVFLPNTEPEGPVQYVLICMEPSLGRWARSADEAKTKVAAGFRNFLFSMEVAILHFCVRNYLCKPKERYHITDLSKGAMLVKQAGRARMERYDRWYKLLLEEINLVACSNVGIVTVGKVVSKYLERPDFPWSRSSTSIIHYSGQAGPARNKGIAEQEDSFVKFKESVSQGHVIATMEEVLRASCVPADICKDGLARLAQSQLTTSRKKLIFNYKVKFDSMRS